MLRGYELAEPVSEDALHQRSREHYREWVDISGVALRRESGADTDLNQEQRTASFLNLWQLREEIRFHTFTAASFRELLACSCARISRERELIISDDLAVEIIVLLRRPH